MSADADARTALLRRELATEVEAGFPHLKRIPATNVVQFVDYVGDLDAKHKIALVDELAAQAARVLARDPARPPSPSIDRLRAALRGPGEFVGGWRYTDVKFLATVPKIEQFGGMERWLSGFGARALEPRRDFLPDTSSFVPAKAPHLRRLVRDRFERDGYAATTFGGGARYLAPGGVLVDVDFGSRMGQLRWSVATGAARATHGLVELPFASLEGIWGLRSDWDVLTEENAQRCIEHLPALVRETLRLGEAARSVA